MPPNMGAPMKLISPTGASSKTAIELESQSNEKLRSSSFVQRTTRSLSLLQLSCLALIVIIT